MKDFSSKKSASLTFEQMPRKIKSPSVLPVASSTFQNISVPLWSHKGHSGHHSQVSDDAPSQASSPPSFHSRSNMWKTPQSISFSRKPVFLGRAGNRGLQSFPLRTVKFFFLSLKWIFLRELNWSRSFQNKALKHSSFRALKFTVITGPVSLQTVDIDIQFAMTL